MSQLDQEYLSADSVLPDGVIGYARNGRKRYSNEFRQRVARECHESNESVAGIALRYGINANLVRKWMDKYAPASQPGMLPVSLSTLAPTRPVDSGNEHGCIVIELGNATITINGPADADILNAVISALR